MDEQLNERSLDALCEILTREIENRMPKHCGKCKEWYIVKLIDKPVIHCMWCKVGMHDCTESKGIRNCKGIKWLCSSCEPIFNKHFLPKLDKAAFFEGFEIEKILSKVNKVNKSVEPESKKTTVVPERRKQVEDKKDNKEKDKREEPVIINQPEGTSAMEGIESAIEENERNKENNRNKERNAMPEPRKEICWFWKNKKCRFTTNCKHDHPEKCKDMIETGRCKNSRCKMIHPKICRNLFYNGYCHRGESCWFTHPSKCENKQPNHMMATQHPNSNHNMNHFLPQWPQMGMGMGMRRQQNSINSAWREGESQGMMQMMQTMMQKIVRMDNKIASIETGGMYFNGI